MSYELISDCGNCGKNDSCTDGEIIRNAANLTHQMPTSCHQGFGKITHECSSFVDKENAVNTPADSK